MIEIHVFDGSRDKQQVPAGSVLFREGDPATAMYAIIEGQVEVTVGDRVIEIVGPASIVGEMALIDHEPRSATARARTDCVVVAIEERQFLFLVDEHPTFALQVMRTMSDRLRRHSHEVVG